MTLHAQIEMGGGVIKMAWILLCDKVTWKCIIVACANSHIWYNIGMENSSCQQISSKSQERDLVSFSSSSSGLLVWKGPKKPGNVLAAHISGQGLELVWFHSCIFMNLSYFKLLIHLEKYSIFNMGKKKDDQFQAYPELIIASYRKYLSFVFSLKTFIYFLQCNSKIICMKNLYFL